MICCASILRVIVKAVRCFWLQRRFWIDRTAEIWTVDKKSTFKTGNISNLFGVAPLATKLWQPNKSSSCNRPNHNKTNWNEKQNAVCRSYFIHRFRVRWSKACLGCNELDFRVSRFHSFTKDGGYSASSYSLAA